MSREMVAKLAVQAEVIVQIEGIRLHPAAHTVAVSVLAQWPAEYGSPPAPQTLATRIQQVHRRYRALVEAMGKGVVQGRSVGAEFKWSTRGSLQISRSTGLVAPVGAAAVTAVGTQVTRTKDHT